MDLSYSWIHAVFLHEQRVPCVSSNQSHLKNGVVPTYFIPSSLDFTSCGGCHSNHAIWRSWWQRSTKRRSVTEIASWCSHAIMMCVPVCVWHRGQMNQHTCEWRIYFFFLFHCVYRKNKSFLVWLDPSFSHTTTVSKRGCQVCLDSVSCVARRQKCSLFDNKWVKARAAGVKSSRKKIYKKLLTNYVYNFICHLTARGFVLW